VADEIQELLASPERETAGTAPRALTRVLRNRFGHLRAGWRLLVYLVAVLAIGKSISAVLKLWLPNPTEAPFTSLAHAVLWVVADLAMVAAGLLVLRFIDRRPPALLGLSLDRGWLRELALGLAGGVVATSALAAVMLGVGAVSLTPSPEAAASLLRLPQYLLVFGLAAAAEELLFRGYPLQVLAEGSRPWLAGTVLCLLFTAAHTGNPDVTVAGIANVLLAAAVLTVLYLQTRRLWLPIGFHLSWNLTQSWLWGFDVSGIEIPDRVVVVTQHGPELLTGGGFGLEGSVLSGLFLAGLLAWLLLRPRAPAPEVAALWAAYPPGFGLAPAAGCGSAADRRADGDGGGAAAEGA
jgi:membrane protease YdiL (CAAX protease family)